MAERLRDQIALVTGGGRGIGRATALSLAAEGAHVVLAARTKREIEAVASEIEALGRQALAVPCDVGYSDQVEALFGNAVRRFGQVDLLVNNAGTYLTGKVVDIEEDAWDDTMRVDLKSFYLCSRAAMRAGRMLERSQGHIINVASISVRREVPELAVHCAFKHAVLGFTESLRREVARQGLRVSLVCPSTVNTRLVQTPEAERMVHGREKWLEPQDIADLIVFVATRRSGTNIGEVSMFGV